ncbi:type II secretion system protein [Paenibacillus sp. JX-17]|uniref:Type II secretion system protein n=1 Tax=Paenibacillus lacisoli TaxID=3064525 RepID=A0ABT9CBF3_9BACL|nr:type II secretion system protein [Paenibacillus sp. JX-17]MDO7906588.1 type II secretion system protein [Paenibacillus sp. JX-17]
MILPKQKQREQGFSLVEVLAAITILSIVSLVLISYFTHALSYSKSNQNKTVMVNLARNALFYVQKQNYDELSAFFREGKGQLSWDQCTKAGACSYDGALFNTAGKAAPPELYSVLNPTINGIDYHVTISYQDKLYDQMANSANVPKKEGAKYLLPVIVTVQPSSDVQGRQSEVQVEGYITDESIR